MRRSERYRLQSAGDRRSESSVDSARQISAEVRGGDELRHEERLEERRGEQ